ncbi:MULTISPECIES: PA2169 family four-helix-bundle protein [Sphingobacterium]|uniref:ferritin-like domain-containing protein n=1 Tax=Sphingobacterium TaxID=28453 RepID=UPI000C0BDB67|nr:MULTISPECIES: PA2169 family four-helix-bundle protein [Sphingobacterium]MCT1531567.1 PA2169 family four-helix-bundle protein [Sphingobacterium daejeonense]
MENTEKQIDLVNDAIEINNDRIKGYEKAIEIAKDANLNELQVLFNGYIEQSRRFLAELKPLVNRTAEEPEEGTKFSGKIFRIWMDIKSAISPSISTALLESCEKGEDEFKETYKNILSDSLNEYPSLVDILQNQLSQQLEAHQKIKELRDLQ